MSLLDDGELLVRDLEDSEDDLEDSEDADQTGPIILNDYKVICVQSKKGDTKIFESTDFISTAQKSTVFIKSVDSIDHMAEGGRKNVTYLAKQIRSVIREVGAENNVQVVMDGANKACWPAWPIINNEFPHIVCEWCTVSSHSLCMVYCAWCANGACHAARLYQGVMTRTRPGSHGVAGRGSQILAGSRPKSSPSGQHEPFSVVLVGAVRQVPQRQDQGPRVQYGRLHRQLRATYDAGCRGLMRGLDG